MIIDAHTHVWPDQVASRALAGNTVPGLSARGDGTAAGLGTAMKDAGVSVSCCLGIANEARHVDRVNAFVAGLRAADRFPVGTVHVDLSVEENLASLQRHGITAVKLHPLFQRFGLDDRRLLDILAAFGEDIAVITHVGQGGDEFTNRLSNPAMVAELARQFPRLRLMACHFGGYRQLEEAERVLAGADVVLETSWPPSLAKLDPHRVRQLIRRHGAERVVFGSDWPMTDPAEEIAAVERLGLTGKETEAVLGGTIARVLGLEPATGA